MKNIIFLSLLLLILSYCQVPVSVIPEITPHINHEYILPLTDKSFVNTLISHNNSLLLIDQNGGIFSFQPGDNSYQTLINLQTEIEPEIQWKNNKIILKKKTSGQYIIFDPAKMETTEISLPAIDEIINLDHELIIYTLDKNLVFYNHQKNSEMTSLKFISKVFNAEFFNSTVIVLTAEEIITFSKNTAAIHRFPLKIPASSYFLLNGDKIYFGNVDKKLIKYSLTRKKIIWQFQLSNLLKIKPQLMGKFIIVSPENNTICVFRQNGTLAFWERFPTSRLTPPQTMKENIGVFLGQSQNPEIFFLNIKSRKSVTSKSSILLLSNPVYLINSLYVISIENEKKCLTRIGNYYYVDLKTDPVEDKAANRPITFTLVPINLIKPYYDLKILDKNKQTVFCYTISFQSKPTFTWIPQKKGKYNLTIDVTTLNQSPKHLSYLINVIAPENIKKSQNPQKTNKSTNG